MDRLESIVRDQSTPSPRAKPPGWLPLFDLKETDDAYTLYIDLPGVEEDDINVDMNGGTVVVSGEREFDHDNEDAEEFTRIERPYGVYRIQVPIPGNVCEDLIRAKYRRGVLKLTIPRKR